MTPTDRIKQEAAKAFPLTNGNDLETGKRIGYIAGATAEHDRAKVLVDALEAIAESECDYESTNYAKAIHSPECRACKAKQTLEQWEGKDTCSKPQIMNIVIEISSCQECPHFKITGTYSTDGFDSGADWHCTKADKKIAGFVEWNERPSIPEWCPAKLTNPKQR